MVRTLDCLGPGQSATVCSLHFPPQRQQRMLDLGFVPGRQVTALMRASLGDPTAYRVLDSVIALRKSDAMCIGID